MAERQYIIDDFMLFGGHNTPFTYLIADNLNNINYVCNNFIGIFLFCLTKSPYLLTIKS